MGEFISHASTSMRLKCYAILQKLDTKVMILPPQEKKVFFFFNTQGCFLITKVTCVSKGLTKVSLPSLLKYDIVKVSFL